MPSSARGLIVTLTTVALVVGGGWFFAQRSPRADAPAAGTGSAAPVAVEVVAVTRDALEERREFAGTLEAKREIVVAAKIGGRLERVSVELGDRVTRGQVIAELDDAELAEAEAQARANLGVARARKLAADNALQIATRNLERVEKLRRRGVIAEEEFDRTRAAKLQAEAAVAVAVSEVTRAQAAKRAAELREAYARVRVDWSEDDADAGEPDAAPESATATVRVVAARHVDDGALVAANTPLITVVALDPLIVAVHVTEQDYARLRPGLPVRLETDAYPGEWFSGQVARIAPVFAERSRRARVELEVQNPDARLRPGMFARVQAAFTRVDDATVVPRAAIVNDPQRGAAVFVVDEDGPRARLQPVTLGVSAGERVQVEGVEPPARVVTLGQSLLRDGARITLAETTAEAE